MPCHAPPSLRWEEEGFWPASAAFQKSKLFPIPPSSLQTGVTQRRRQNVALGLLFKRGRGKTADPPPPFPKNLLPLAFLSWGRVPVGGGGSWSRCRQGSEGEGGTWVIITWKGKKGFFHLFRRNCGLKSVGRGLGVE